MFHQNVVTYLQKEFLGFLFMVDLKKIYLIFFKFFLLGYNELYSLNLVKSTKVFTFCFSFEIAITSKVKTVNCNFKIIWLFTGMY